MSKLGIDVSYHQGIIDWKKVKESGIEFAIIRAGYGKSNVDKQFKNNVNGCIENNIPFGVYWFIYGVNPAEAVQNAVKCHETIKQYKDKISMRVWCDLEYDTDRNAQKRGFNLTKEVRTEMVIAFCEKMKEYGYSVGNYANPDYLNNKLNDLSQYPLWLARYSTTKGNYECEMWQYSSKGIVPGINGNVDMNHFYGDFKKTEDAQENAQEDNTEVLVNTDGKIIAHAYSKAKEGNNKLTENFRVREFSCNDGSDVVFVAPSLVEILQKIRNHFGKAVNINSAYRTPSYNKKVGGATYSQHLYGTAADIRINGVSPKYIASYAETLLPNSGGIGIYKNFVHVDVRKDKSRWNG